MNPAPILVLAAHRQEIDPLLRRLLSSSELLPARGEAVSARLEDVPLLLGRTGVGPAAADGSLRALLRDHCPRLVLQIGYAGALRPELEPGALILADGYLAYPEGEPQAPPARLVERAQVALVRSGFPVQIGPTVTVDHTVAGDDEREQLSKLAPVVQMEDHAAALVCREVGVPFLSLRIVSDRADSRLGRLLEGYPETGRLLRLRRWVHVGRHPRRTLALHRLVRTFPVLSGNLARATPVVILSVAQAFPPEPGGV